MSVSKIAVSCEFIKWVADKSDFYYADYVDAKPTLINIENYGKIIYILSIDILNTKKQV